jgi:hypothetical protein
MTTSPKTPFLSEVLDGEKKIPPGKLAYFRERFRDHLYEVVVTDFLKKEAAGNLTRAQLARRIGRRPEQITRWLAAPGNWTLETVSDLMLAISKAEPRISTLSLENRAARNFLQPDWLSNDANRSQIKTESKTVGTAKLEFEPA